MENYSKIIESVLNKLDWDCIMNYYNKIGEVEEVSNRKQQLKPKSLITIKKELKDLIQFVIDSNFKELHHNHWILYFNNDNGFRLEVVFAPTRSIYTDKDADSGKEPDELVPDDMEKEVLGDMLNKAVKEENYELAQVIHNRLKRLVKTSVKKLSK